MADHVLPGDLNAGDVITLPDDQGDVVVKSVRLGGGGFLLTVGPVDGEPDYERVITLAATAPMWRRGHGPAF